MNYSFIEIGTSDFDTMIQRSDDSTVGLSIEPIKIYLDRLPNKKNVTKINCAIAFDGVEGKDTMYYISPEVLKENLSLPNWLRGCNRLGDYHLQHKNLKIEHLVETVEVDIIPIARLFEIYKVDKVNTLKLDTEGGDCYILKQLLPVLKEKDKSSWPTTILFETNILSAEALIQETILCYETLGYVSNRARSNTTLTLIA